MWFFAGPDKAEHAVVPGSEAVELHTDRELHGQATATHAVGLTHMRPSARPRAEQRRAELQAMGLSHVTLPPQ
jgi:hypothetical protein